MHYSNVKLSNLNTIEACQNAIDAIENDYQNIAGGFKAWNSGYQTELTKAAQNKIEAIQRKEDKLFSLINKEKFKKYQSDGGELSFEEFMIKYCD